MNGNRVTDYDAFYASAGDPERKALKEFPYPFRYNYYMDRPHTRTIQITTEKGEKLWVPAYNQFAVKNLKLKLYDKTGKFVGYAKTDGTTDYKIYDTDENEWTTDQTLYTQPGVPLGSFWDIYKDYHTNR